METREKAPGSVFNLARRKVLGVSEEERCLEFGRRGKVLGVWKKKKGACGWKKIGV